MDLVSILYHTPCTHFVRSAIFVVKVELIQPTFICIKQVTLKCHFSCRNTTFYNSWFFGQSRDFWYRVLYRKRYFLPPQPMPMIIKREPVVIFRKCINNWRCYYVLIPKVTARGLQRKIKEICNLQKHDLSKACSAKNPEHSLWNNCIKGNPSQCATRR